MREAAAMALAMMILAMAGSGGDREARVPVAYSGETADVIWF